MTCDAITSQGGTIYLGERMPLAWPPEEGYSEREVGGA